MNYNLGLDIRSDWFLRFNPGDVIDYEEKMSLSNIIIF